MKKLVLSWGSNKLSNTSSTSVPSRAWHEVGSSSAPVIETTAPSDHSSMPLINNIRDSNLAKMIELGWIQGNFPNNMSSESDFNKLGLNVE